MEKELLSLVARKKLFPIRLLLSLNAPLATIKIKSKSEQIIKVKFIKLVRNLLSIRNLNQSMRAKLQVWSIGKMYRIEEAEAEAEADREEEEEIEEGAEIKKGKRNNNSQR